MPFCIRSDGLSLLSPVYDVLQTFTIVVFSRQWLHILRIHNNVSIIHTTSNNVQKYLLHRTISIKLKQELKYGNDRFDKKMHT